MTAVQQTSVRTAGFAAMCGIKTRAVLGRGSTAYDYKSITA